MFVVLVVSLQEVIHALVVGSGTTILQERVDQILGLKFLISRICTVAFTLSRTSFDTFYIASRENRQVFPYQYLLLDVVTFTMTFAEKRGVACILAYVEEYSQQIQT